MEQEEVELQFCLQPLLLECGGRPTNYRNCLIVQHQPLRTAMQAGKGNLSRSGTCFVLLSAADATITATTAA
jgi:hypothetical protein